jgi:Na+-transporting NADH:ubiquinone oxidoreductase subunit C
VAEADVARAPDAGAPAAQEPGPVRTLLVALAVSFVCALLVTTSVVVLRPFERENRQRERERRILAMVAGIPGVAELVGDAAEARIELRAVELDSGAYAAGVDAEALLRRDVEAREGEPLPADRDPARIGWRPRYAPVFLLRRGGEEEGEVEVAILPIRGRGYVSMMRGYLAVAGDGNTVRGITFTEHQETPGVGAEIVEPAWQAGWRGKRLRDESGEIRIRVVKEAPAAGAPAAAYQVQGISGATRTGVGVTELVRFWVGPQGFGPYLQRLRQDRREPRNPEEGGA